MIWRTLAPLEYDSHTLEVPFDLGNNVLLCVRPDWFTQEEITYALGDYDRTLLDASPYVLMQDTMLVRSAIPILNGLEKYRDQGRGS